MSIPTGAVVAVAQQLERQGFFARVKQGDERAASYFARLVAYTANPNGDTSSWGWLKKTAGGFNIEGYADGAIVYGSNPNDLNNVVKIVVQVGSKDPNAIRIGDAIQPRREVDVWEAPRPLSLEQMRYLNPAYEPGPVTPPPTPQPPPSNDLATVKAQLEALTNVVASLTVAIANLHTDDVNDLRNRINDVRNTLKNGLAIDASGKIPFAGSVSLKGSAKG